MLALITSRRVRPDASVRVSCAMSDPPDQWIRRATGSPSARPRRRAGGTPCAPRPLLAEEFGVRAEFFARGLVRREIETKGPREHRLLRATRAARGRRSPCQKASLLPGWGLGAGEWGFAERRWGTELFSPGSRTKKSPDSHFRRVLECCEKGSRPPQIGRSGRREPRPPAETGRARCGRARRSGRCPSRG